MIYGLKRRNENKGNKGETDIRFLLAGIVALFVLVLVGIGAYSLYTGKAIPFAQYLPDFMTKKEKIEVIEKIRYQIIEDKVQYYDGTIWLDFKGKNVELGEKTIVKDEVKKDFKRYYFNEDVRLEEDPDLNFLFNNPDVIQKGSPLKKGDVFVRFFSKNELLILDNYDVLKKYNQDKDKTSSADYKIEPYKSIRVKAIIWRDSVLKKPISIGFLVGSTSERIMTCVKKIGTDLVVDLMEESESCG